MKYFKHRVASGDNPHVGEAIELFGTDAYYVFFRTLEIMARHFDINDPGVSNFNYKWFLKRFQKSFKRKTITNILNYFHDRNRLLYEINGDTITLKCEKLKEDSDEYTRKLLQKISDKYPTNVQNLSAKCPTKIKNKNKSISKDIDIHKETRHAIIKHLNKRAGKGFNPDSDDAISFVNGRLNDKKNPTEVEDLIRVIDVKCAQWLGTEQESYLRPATLFRPSNFENYRNERYIPPRPRGYQPTETHVGRSSAEEKDPVSQRIWDKAATAVYQDAKKSGQDPDDALGKFFKKKCIVFEVSQNVADWQKLKFKDPGTLATFIAERYTQIGRGADETH